jgi:hypothetical protein
VRFTIWPPKSSTTAWTKPSRGHASRIEVILEPGNRLTISDNGRGIPIDQHPKYPGKSALEVILTMLHSGGKFSDKAYATSGGLHGVGVSVVNALSSETIVEVARNKELYRQTFRRANRPSKLVKIWSDAEPPRHDHHLRPGSSDFRRGGQIQAGETIPAGQIQSLSIRRVEIRWRCDPLLISDETRLKLSSSSRRPRRSSEGADRRARMRDQRILHRPPGLSQFAGHGRMGGRLAAVERRRLILLLQHHPDARRRYARAGHPDRA